MKVELANDILAKKVYEAASAKDKARMVASRFIQERCSASAGVQSTLLNDQELAFVQPYLGELVLDTQQKTYIEDSRKNLLYSKRRKRLKDAAIVIVICSCVLSIWGFWEHRRYSTTHAKLAVAYDSIGLLLTNMRNTSLPESTSIGTTATPLPFHTLHIYGKITTTDGQPIDHATIQVLGAITESTPTGRYDLHLILPIQYWKENPTLYITKEHYQERNQVVDLELNQMEWNPVLNPTY